MLSHHKLPPIHSVKMSFMLSEEDAREEQGRIYVFLLLVAVIYTGESQ